MMIRIVRSFYVLIKSIYNIQSMICSVLYDLFYDIINTMIKMSDVYNEIILHDETILHDDEILVFSVTKFLFR